MYHFVNLQTQSMPCNGVCQDDMMLCGVNNDMNEHKYMCFHEVMFSHNFPQFD